MFQPYPFSDSVNSLGVLDKPTLTNWGNSLGEVSLK